MLLCRFFDALAASVQYEECALSSSRRLADRSGCFSHIDVACVRAREGCPQLIRLTPGWP